VRTGYWLVTMSTLAHVAVLIVAPAAQLG